jgi:RNA 2',3'-cyclic 3'-phosphodiesterase
VAEAHPTSSGSRTQRLFVGVSIPEHAADAIDRAIEPWRDAYPRARWVPRINWHVTLCFLGSSPERLLPWIGERLAEVSSRTAPFDTCVRGLGAFPSPRRAHVLWAGLEDDEGVLATLAHAVSEALAGEFPPRRRRFSAHVTVAKSPGSLSLPMAFTETSLQGAPFEVGAITLVRSHLRRPAPVYEPVLEHPLSGS